MVTSREMRAHLFICWPRERARRGPLAEQMCMCACVCVNTSVYQHVALCVFVCVCVCVRVRVCMDATQCTHTDTPGLIN